MTATSLTSDHVNYLVWRYLQESGYGESAVKLQRDWTEDPQHLQFSQYIKTHALVSLVQKGLQYHEIEQSLDQRGQPLPSSDSVYFFGPGSGQAVSSNGVVGELVAYGGDHSPRKHARDLGPNGLSEHGATQPAARRNPKSHGEENGDAMDLDEPDAAEPHRYPQSNGHVHAETTRSEPPARAPPSPEPDVRPGQIHAYTQPTPPPAALPPQALPLPLSNAAATGNATATTSAGTGTGTGQTSTTTTTTTTIETPTPTPRTNGSSVGTQVDKITELGPDTTFLHLELERSGSVMHCAWNPADPASLLTAGTDALCRIWTLPPPSSSASTSSPSVLTAHVDLDDGPRVAWQVTTVVWSPDGNHVAVAVCDPESVYHGQVTIWSKTGALVMTLPVGQDAVLCLRWNPSGTVLLGICASVRGGNVMLWDPLTADPFDCLEVDAPLEDAEWLDDSNFVVTGGNILETYQFDGRARLIQSYPPPGHDNLWLVRYDSTSRTVATCTHGTRLEFWMNRECVSSTNAHDEEITALEWQPLPSGRTNTGPRLLATSSLDGTVRIWGGREPWSLLHTLSLGHINPVMAMAFSTDGTAIAAVSYGRILVWNAREGGTPKAVWNGKMLEEARTVNGNTAAANGDSDADIHSLSWDADSSKIAYTVNRQIAVINVRR